MTGVSPIADPTVYPGAPVGFSCLLTHDDVWPLEIGPDGWLVDFSGERFDVEAALDRLGAAPMAERTPVLAVGSNASAAQLRRKWAGEAHMAVPLTWVDVTGLGVGFSAHVSKAGYVPYAPLKSTGVSARFVVSWLTSAEVAVLDATEPNYVPTVLDGAAFPAVLENGQGLKSFTVYRGRWGVICGEDGAPVPAGSQEAALALLAGFGRYTNAVFGSDEALRASATKFLTGSAGPDGFADPLPDRKSM